VNPLVVHSLQAYYSYFMDAGRIETSYNINSEHCLPTVDYGEDCTVLSSPFLGNCQYDGAGAALRTMYGTLQPRTVADASRLYRFDQKPYIGQKYSSIGDVGFIYVPKACEDGVSIVQPLIFLFFCTLCCFDCRRCLSTTISTSPFYLLASQTNHLISTHPLYFLPQAECALHISFHGCHMGVTELGDTYAQHAGFNEWAESNKIVVLYPTVEPSDMMPYNPNG